MTLFNRMYKSLNFKIKIELTSTKIIAWVVLILGVSIVSLIPAIDRAEYLDNLFWVIATLYGVKNVQELFKSNTVKIEEKDA